MDSNVQYSEEENCSADEHMIDNKHPGEIEQKYKNDQTQNTSSKMYYRDAGSYLMLFYLHASKSHIFITATG